MAWDPEDQDKAIFWLSSQNEKCPSCNTIQDDWLDEEGIPYDPPPYELESKRCIGCKTMAEAQDELTKNKERGVFLFFRRLRGR